MTVKIVLIFTLVTAFFGNFGHKWLVEKVGYRILNGFASIVSTQSKERYKVSFGRVSRDGALGLQVQNFRIFSEDAVQEMVSFKSVVLSFPSSLFWSSEPMVELLAEGKSGGLRAQVKLDRTAFFKGFIHQVWARYEFLDFNVGPILDDLLKFYFSKGSLQRSNDHPDFKLNGRLPVKLTRLSEIKLKGELKYVAKSLPEADFGNVDLNAEITSVQLAAGGERDARNFIFGKSVWSMQTKNRIISSRKPIVLRSPEIHLRLEPRIEITREIPHRWSSFLFLDLEPRTKEGAAFANVFAEDWRCGVGKNHKGKMKLLAFFQHQSLGCMQRPK